MVRITPPSAAKSDGSESGHREPRTTAKSRLDKKVNATLVIHENVARLQDVHSSKIVSTIESLEDDALTQAQKRGVKKLKTVVAPYIESAAYMMLPLAMKQLNPARGLEYVQ